MAERSVNHKASHKLFTPKALSGHKSHIASLRACLEIGHLFPIFSGVTACLACWLLYRTAGTKQMLSG